MVCQVSNLEVQVPLKQTVCIIVNNKISKLVHLFLCVKDLALLVTGPPQLLLLEIGIIERLGDLHTRDVDFGVGGNDKLLVRPAQGNSVQGKRAYKCAKKQMLEDVNKRCQTSCRQNYFMVICVNVE